MGRLRKSMSAFAGLAPEIKQALRSSAVTTAAVVSSPGNPASPKESSVIEDMVLDYGSADPELDPTYYAPAQRPAKRPRLGDLEADDPAMPVDARTLVPFYASEEGVPAHLLKYWSQRERFFSRYSEGCLLDEEGWYSVTPERIALQIATRCACNVVLDAFCGVGGNAIAFAQTCERVIAIDNSATRLALARHNAKIYGVEDRIEFILGDFIDFARSYNPTSLRIDVVFLSPPWGGPEYLTSSPKKAGGADYLDAHPEYSLSSVQPLHGAQLFALASRITPHVAYYLPRNTNLDDVGALTASRPEGSNSIEIEEEWMGNKLKALTCYFGGLAEGQEHLWQ